MEAPVPVESPLAITTHAHGMMNDDMYMYLRRQSDRQAGIVGCGRHGYLSGSISRITEQAGVSRCHQSITSPLAQNSRSPPLPRGNKRLTVSSFQPFTRRRTRPFFAICSVRAIIKPEADSLGIWNDTIIFTSDISLPNNSIHQNIWELITQASSSKQEIDILKKCFDNNFPKLAPKLKRQ